MPGRESYSGKASFQWFVVARKRLPTPYDHPIKSDTYVLPVLTPLSPVRVLAPSPSSCSSPPPKTAGYPTKQNKAITLGKLDHTTCGYSLDWSTGCSWTFLSLVLPKSRDLIFCRCRRLADFCDDLMDGIEKQARKETRRDSDNRIQTSISPPDTHVDNRLQWCFNRCFNCSCFPYGLATESAEFGMRGFSDRKRCST